MTTRLARNSSVPTPPTRPKVVLRRAREARQTSADAFQAPRSLHPRCSVSTLVPSPLDPSASPGQVKCMTPTELKAALQRTFDMRLSPAQLGAVTHLFGTGGDASDADACDGGTYVLSSSRPRVPLLGWRWPPFFSEPCFWGGGAFVSSAVSLDMRGRRGGLGYGDDMRVVVLERPARKGDLLLSEVWVNARFQPDASGGGTVPEVQWRDFNAQAHGPQYVLFRDADHLRLSPFARSPKSTIKLLRLARPS